MRPLQTSVYRLFVTTIMVSAALMATMAEDLAGMEQGLVGAAGQAEPPFRIEIEQDGEPVLTLNDFSGLLSRPFDIIIESPDPCDIWVNASFNDTLYGRAQAEEPLGTTFAMFAIIMEDLRNPNEEIRIGDETNHHHWFFRQPEFHSFSEVTRTTTGYRCRRTVSRVVLEDGEVADIAALENRILFLVFYQGEDLSVAETRERHRAYRRLVFMELQGYRAFASPAGGAGTKAEPSVEQVRQLLELMDAQVPFDQLLDDLLTQIQRAMPLVLPSVWEEFRAEAGIDEVYDLLVPIYQESLTIADTEALIAFWSTPVGRRFIKQQQRIAEERQEWGTQVMNRLLRLVGR